MCACWHFDLGNSIFIFTGNRLALECAHILGAKLEASLGVFRKAALTSLILRLTYIMVATLL